MQLARARARARTRERREREGEGKRREAEDAKKKSDQTIGSTYIYNTTPFCGRGLSSLLSTFAFKDSDECSASSLLLWLCIDLVCAPLWRNIVHVDYCRFGVSGGTQSTSVRKQKSLCGTRCKIKHRWMQVHPSVHPPAIYINCTTNQNYGSQNSVAAKIAWATQSQPP